MIMRLRSPHHVRFQVTDLDKQEAFAIDFGLVVQERTSERLVMRTCGGDRCSYVAFLGDRDAFLGFALEVEDASDLDHAHTALGGTAPTPLDLPGGGMAVTLHDSDGNEVLLIHGAERGEPEELYAPLEINTPFENAVLGAISMGEIVVRRGCGGWAILACLCAVLLHPNPGMRKSSALSQATSTTFQDSHRHRLSAFSG